MSDEGGVAAVERALAILDALTDERVTLAQISKRTGLYKSTLLRLIRSLEKFGYVFRTDDGAYRIGASAYRIGTLYQRHHRMGDVVCPVLRRVVAELHEGASFYVAEGDKRICLHRVDASRAVRDAVHEGDPLPLTVGAAGHVLRAFAGTRGEKFAEIRRRMYAASFGERDPETAAVAAPVLGLDNRLLGALSISGPRYRIEAAGVERIVPVLFRHARDLTRLLGGDADAEDFAAWRPAARTSGNGAPAAVARRAARSPRASSTAVATTAPAPAAAPRKRTARAVTATRNRSTA